MACLPFEVPGWHKSSRLFCTGAAASKPCRRLFVIREMRSRVRVLEAGTPGRDRTCDRPLRRRVLSPLSYGGKTLADTANAADGRRERV